MLINNVWLDYKDKLRSYLNNRVSEPADAEDLIQEVAVKAIRNIHSLQSSENTEAWLWAIARNCLIDFYRKKAPYAELDDEIALSTGSDTRYSLDLQQCLLPLLRSMPTEQLDIIMFIELNGVSQKNYAKEHDLSYSTLKSRVQKSRRELQGRFLSCCNIELDACGKIMDYQVKSNAYNCC